MDIMDEVDIIHPLATLDWKKCCNLPEGTVDAQCVILNDSLYVGGGGTLGDDDKLFVSTTDLKSWSQLTTPTSFYGLTTYHSQVVLVGGIDVSTGLITTKLWTLNGDVFQPLLPPMPTARSAPSVMNIDTDCVIVTGGRADNDYTVDILRSNSWSTVKLPPKTTSDNKSAVHNGRLYLVESDTESRMAITCDLKTLIDSCTTPGINEESLWSLSNKLPFEFCNIVSYGQRLLSIGGMDITGSQSSKILAHSPLSHSWVHVGDIPTELEATAVIVLPSREIVVIGGRNGDVDYCDEVYRASLKESPYDPDSQFSMSSLSRLEEANIPILTSLSQTRSQLVAAAGFKEPLTDEDYEDLDFEYIIEQWQSEESQLPPTWRSLHYVLKKIDLNHLSQQIQHFFNGASSLRDLCTSVIMSALLQQRSLEPDQLHVRLPDYVPPTVKRYITHEFKAHTIQPTPPTPSPPSSKRVCSDLPPE